MIKNAHRIVSLNAAAARLGLSAGIGLVDARAMHPGLAVAEEDPEADRLWLESVADACERYTPLVGLDLPDGLLLDITGCAHLFGGEEGLRLDLLRRLGSGGVSARAAIAGTVGCAWALARHGVRPAAPSGAEADALKSLPVAALRLSPDSIEALARVGFRRIEDVIAAPRAPLAARFGERILRRLDQALGVEEEAISPRRSPPSFVAEQRFADPIGRQEDVLGIIEQLAHQIARLLERHLEGARALQATLFRVDGHIRCLRVATSRPTRDAALVRRLFQDRLTALGDLDPGFGFDLIRLSAERTDPLAPAQRGFGEPRRELDMADLIDRLGARFGPHSVLWLVPQNRHRPEHAVAARPAHRDREDDAPLEGGQDSLGPIRPIRLFERPEAVETLAEVPDGPPLRFRWRRILHEVVCAEGPERIAPEWWRAGSPSLTRDYFRVETRQGVRVWLYREGLYAREATHPRWFVHGLFA